MIISNGLRQPALRGISSSTRVRKTYNTAALQTAVGALKLLGSWGDVSVKSIFALRFFLSILTEIYILLPSSRIQVAVLLVSDEDNFLRASRTEFSALF